MHHRSSPSMNARCIIEDGRAGRNLDLPLNLILIGYRLARALDIGRA